MVERYTTTLGRRDGSQPGLRAITMSQTQRVLSCAKAAGA
jgi:hypothetical protein